MTRDELKQAAIDVLAKAFKGDEVPAHVVQAAVSVLLYADPTYRAGRTDAE
jgi:hypothetical protein